MRARRRALGVATAIAAALAAALAAPAALRAQDFDLTLTGGPLVFPAPTAASFVTGLLAHPTPLSFVVDARGRTDAVVATVAVRALSPALGAGKSIADLEWRRGDSGVWQSLATTDATVETRPLQRDRTNDPWGNAIFLRLRLGWLDSPPGTYAAELVVTLTVVAP